MPRQRQTNADRLRWTCVKCGALGGAPCVDYKGDPQKHCVERGRPHITQAKNERKASERNAKTVKAAGGGGSLLTYFYGSEEAVVEAAGERLTTADEVAEQKLRELRRGVESGGHAEWAAVNGLNWIMIRHMRRTASALIGAEWELILWNGAFGTYGTNLLHVVTRYQQILCTTESVVLGYERKFDPARVKVIVHPPNEYRSYPLETKLDGWYAAPTGTWPPEGYTPVMTRDEFRARFRLHHLSVKPADDLTDDPSGLFSTTIGGLAR